MIEHDFNKYPELTNAQMEQFQFDSPHVQIFEDFDAEVVKVHDGDTITLATSFRDFDFPVRFHGTNAKEMGEGGQEAQVYLEGMLLGEDVRILIDANNRVGKFGRLIGKVIHRGIDIGEHMIMTGRSTSFDNRSEGKTPNIDKEVNIGKWL